jgi:hypothetical protein
MEKKEDIAKTIPIATPSTLQKKTKKDSDSEGDEAEDEVEGLLN